MREKTTDAEVFEEFIRENPGVVVSTASSCESMDEMLKGVSVECPTLGAPVDGLLCMECDHFVRFKRGPDGSIRADCWTHRRRRRGARGTEALPGTLPGQDDEV